MFGPILLGAGIGKVTAVNNTKTFTITQLPFVLSLFQVGYAFNVTQNEFLYSPIQGKALGSLSLSGTTYTFTFKEGTVCATDDEIHIQVWPYPLGYDVNQNNQLFSLQNPGYDHSTDSEEILNGTPYELTASFADVGPEIDVDTFSHLILWPTIDIGTSVTTQFRLLHKHTSAGAEEYREIYLGSPSSNLTIINLNDYQLGTDADQLFKIRIPVLGTKYVQIQAKDSANGDGQIDALYITKGWGG